MRNLLWTTLFLLGGAGHALAATLSLAGTGTVTAALDGVGVSVGDKFSFEATVSDVTAGYSELKEASQAVYKLTSFDATIGSVFVGDIPPDAHVLLFFNKRQYGPTQVTLHLGSPDRFNTTAPIHNFRVSWDFEPTEPGGIFQDVSFEELAALDFSTATKTSFSGIHKERPHGVALEGVLHAPGTTPIPLPTGLWLGLAGLTALGLTRRRGIPRA